MGKDTRAPPRVGEGLLAEYTRLGYPRTQARRDESGSMALLAGRLVADYTTSVACWQEDLFLAFRLKAQYPYLPQLPKQGSMV